MSERLTISIDAMGGDDAPHMVIEGVSIAHRKLPHVDFLLFGDGERIQALLNKYPGLDQVCEIHHTDDFVSNNEKPSIALRSGRNSSMRLAINAVKDGKADGIVSAGNTGALMGMAKFVLKTLPGIDRPAIATYFPTENGDAVMLDLGANVVCTANNLVQFAVMGEVFARHVLKIKEPTIGILNIGSEDTKGHEYLQQAASILQNSDLPIKFHGFVEGDGICGGDVNVIVTDGFTGNVALKTAEGTAKMFTLALRGHLKASLLGRIGALIAMPAINAFRRQFDPRSYNGAMFLGLNGICIKSHGGTDAVGFAHAIDVAEELIGDGLNEDIKHDYSQLGSTQFVTGDDAVSEAAVSE